MISLSSGPAEAFSPQALNSFSPTFKVIKFLKTWTQIVTRNTQTLQQAIIRTLIIITTISFALLYNMSRLLLINNNDMNKNNQKLIFI